MPPNILPNNIRECKFMANYIYTKKKKNNSINIDANETETEKVLCCQEFTSTNQKTTFCNDT